MSARLPLFVDLRGRRVLIVGGGAAAERKLPALLGAGVSITLIAPSVRERVRRLLRAAPVARLIERRAHANDVTAAYSLLFPLTGDRKLNQELADAARAARVWVVGSSDPDCGDVHLAALVERGAVRLALSTGAGSPTLARLLAELLRQLLPDAPACDEASLRRVRLQLRRTLAGPARRRALLAHAVAVLEPGLTLVPAAKRARRGSLKHGSSATELSLGGPPDAESE